MAQDGREIRSRLLRGAVAGAVAGIAAAFAMDRFQAAVRHFSHSDDDGEPATAKAADRLARGITGRAVPKAQKPLAGQAVHYALGAALGIGYGISVAFRPATAAGYGAAFGLGTAALLDEAAVPGVGLAPPPWRTGLGTHVYGAASHLVFGVTIEAVRAQVDRALAPKG